MILPSGLLPTVPKDCIKGHRDQSIHANRLAVRGRQESLVTAKKHEPTNIREESKLTQILWSELIDVVDNRSLTTFLSKQALLPSSPQRDSQRFVAA
jgi:hypothetical protein